MTYHISSNQYKNMKIINDLDGTIASNGDIRELSIDYYNIFRKKYPNMQLENSIGHVFITRPDLHIVTSGGAYNPELAARPEFAEFFRNNANARYYRKLMLQLCSSFASNNLMTELSSHIENFEVSDEVIKTRDVPQTMNDWKMNYAGNINESQSAGTITLNYTDNRYLDIYYTHYFWVIYMALVKDGFLTPNRNYIHDKIMDYAASLYYFLLAEDGCTILFYSKLTGVFPLNIPSSTMSWNMGEHKQLKYSIQYNYNHKESMNPEILGDFMRANPELSGRYFTGSPRSLYDPVNDVMAKPWTAGPYIKNVNGVNKLYFT